jgi:hypothetical protein
MVGHAGGASLSPFATDTPMTGQRKQL